MTRFFTGMPAPAAAGVVLVPMMLTFALGQDWPNHWALNALAMIAVALMMVSSVKTFSIKMVTTRVSPEYLLPTLVGIGVIIAALVNVPWWTLLTVAAIYLVSLPIGIVTARKLAAQAEAAKADEASTDDQFADRAETQPLRLASGTGGKES
jgi:CDP-diacylglycerol--serine O-phosphatidyltransferase